MDTQTPQAAHSSRVMSVISIVGLLVGLVIVIAGTGLGWHGFLGGLGIGVGIGVMLVGAWFWGYGTGARRTARGLWRPSQDAAQ